MRPGLFGLGLGLGFGVRVPFGLCGLGLRVEGFRYGLSLLGGSWVTGVISYKKGNYI